METQLVAANVVLAARQFNTSIVNQLWLVENDIVRREEFRPGCVFTDMLVNIVAEQFTLFVSPEQLQFTPSASSESVQDLVLDRVGKLVATIPHTPYFACGLNFIWHCSSENVRELSRDLFAVPTSPLHQQFEGDDSRFGGYLSRSFHDGRLKLDVKPLTVQVSKVDDAEERLQFAFNFHWDVSRENDAVVQINDHLSHWNDALEMSNQISKSIETANK